MDAVTAAAALAIVVDESQQSAMEALLREREQLAMLAAHHESYMAQRHYVGTLQTWQPRPMTWETAFTQRHNELADAHQVMRLAANALRAGDAETALARLDALRAGDAGTALARLEGEVGSESADEEMTDAVEEEEEEEDMEDDAEVEA